MNIEKNNFRRLLVTILPAFVLMALMAALTFAPPFASKVAPQVFAVAHGQDVSPAATANVPAPATEKAELYQALLDLTSPFTVMCVAAHPDDEDGTSLIVMRRKYGAHTVSLFSTFGEGGQNAIGPELYEELGAIRARETMAAAEIQGSEPHFLGLKDFGFSKSADEAFRVWGHDEALRRMVLQIRKLRPDVIITNHSVTNNDHGHHQATARLELEAFDAAADPKRFPEQLKDGVTVWQVQRLFVRVGRSNQAQAKSAPVVTIDPNERDPIRGMVFAEEALRALQKHATQGPWPSTFADMLRFRNSQDGKLPLIRYVLTREAEGAGALPKGPQNFLDGLQLPEKEAKIFAPPTIHGKPLSSLIDQRRVVFDALASEERRIDAVLARDKIRTGSDAAYRVGLIYGRISNALLLASGITSKLVGPDVLRSGGNAYFSFIVSNSGVLPVNLRRRSFQVLAENRIGLLCCPTLTSNLEIAPGTSAELPLNYSSPSDAKLTVPHALHLYDERVFGSQVGTQAETTIGGTQIWVEANKWVDIAPAIEIASTSPSLLVVTPQTSDRPPILKLVVKSHLDRAFEGLAGAFANYPSRRGFELVSTTLSLAPGESQEVSMSPRMKIEEFSNIELTVETDRDKSRSLLSKATVPIIKADARVAPNLRVGYVRGFDYSLPNALNALGVESKELSVDELKTADLQKYSTIIVDNRVYESQPELITANQKLLDYAKDGGTLIVFYHKSNEWNPDARRNRPQLAPYKLILGDRRITDETAPISFLEPQHPLLNIPNRLGQDDFANWIQERGLYYPKDWDPQFHALLQSNDPGEAPLKGGLLVADYGRGHYIYTSMVWYRQLRAGVPGGYRMFANMISFGH